MKLLTIILRIVAIASLSACLITAGAGESMGDDQTLRLQQEILTARKTYGENSMQHLAAIAESVNYLSLSKDVTRFRAQAQDLIGRIEKVFSERHPALIEPSIMLARSHINAQEYDLALPWLEKAYAPLSWERYSRDRDAVDPTLLAVTECELGRAYLKLGRLQPAENMLQRCINRFRYKSTADDPKMLSEGFHLLAGSQSLQGNTQEALISEEESLAVLRRYPGATREAIAERQVNIEQMRALALPLPERLQANLRALQLADSVFPPTAEPVAIAVSQAANTYHALGQYPEALNLRQRAVRIAEATTGADSAQTTDALYGLSTTLGASGDRKGEFDALMRAKGNVERRTPPDEMLSAKLYGTLATASLSAHWSKLMGDESALPLIEIRDAIVYAEKAVAITERHRPLGHLHRQVARAVLGLTRLFGGNADGAISEFEEALIGEVDSSTEARKLRIKVLSLMAIAYGVKGQGEVSVLWGKEAVNARQALRLVAGDALANRSGQREQEDFVYQLLSALLVAQGRLQEAQQVIQMSREHELNMTVRSEKDDPRSTRVDLSEKEARALAAYAKAKKQVGALISEQNALLGKQATGGLSDADQLRLNKLVTSLVPSGVVEAKRILRQLETDFSKGKQGQPGRKINAVARDNSAIRRAVDRANAAWPNLPTVGVQYVLDRDRLTIILTPPRAPQQSYQLPIDRAALYRRIQEALLLLQSPDSTPAALSVPLKKLHATLIGPIEGALRVHGAKSLFLSLAPELRLLPFAALLNSEGRYLVDSYAIALFNEAAEKANQSAARSDSGYRVAAMGATDVGNNLPRLPAVPHELSAVISAAGVSGDQFLDKAFTRKRLQAELAPGNPSRHNLLHIASHFVLNPGRPNDSALYFGDGSTLSLAELVADRLDFSAFNLVTYSACQTAVSTGMMNDGREMESLSVRTQRQGANAVMATLWKISDRSSPNIMKAFYSEIGTRRAPLHGALQKLQSRLIAATEHPYLWAAYVISMH